MQGFGGQGVRLDWSWSRHLDDVIVRLSVYCIHSNEPQLQNPNARNRSNLVGFPDPSPQQDEDKEEEIP